MADSNNRDKITRNDNRQTTLTGFRNPNEKKKNRHPLLVSLSSSSASLAAAAPRRNNNDNAKPKSKKRHNRESASFSANLAPIFKHNATSSKNNKRTKKAIEADTKGGIQAVATEANTKVAVKWQNKSLANAPLFLLRDAAIGGHTPSQRQATLHSLTHLPDWNDKVTFRIFGKECRMRRRICQYSSGGALSYSYSGLRDVVAPPFPEIVLEIKHRVEALLCDFILKGGASSAANGGNKMETDCNFPSPQFVQIVQQSLLENNQLLQDNDESLCMPQSKSSAESSAESRKKSNSQSKRPPNEIFNYCLLNHYRSGEEYIGYHADDESDLDPHTPIASVSLGVTRNFDIRARKSRSRGTATPASSKQQHPQRNGTTATTTTTSTGGRLGRIPLGDGDVLFMFPPMQRYYDHAVPVEKRVLGERVNLTFRRVIEK